MDIITFIKNVVALILTGLIIAYTFVSIKRMVLKNPPNYIKRYISTIIIAFSVLTVPFFALRYVTHEGSLTSLVMLFLTLISYVVFYTFSKALRFKHFKVVEQLFISLAFIITLFALIHSHPFNWNHKSVITASLLTLALYCTGFTIYLLIKNYSSSYKEYLLLFINTFLACLQGIIFSLFFRDIFPGVENLLFLIIMLGYCLSLIFVIYRYYLDIKNFVSPVFKEHKLFYTFTISSSSFIILKEYSLKHDEDINGIIHRLI